MSRVVVAVVAAALALVAAPAFAMAMTGGFGRGPLSAASAVGTDAGALAWPWLAALGIGLFAASVTLASGRLARRATPPATRTVRMGLLLALGAAALALALLHALVRMEPTWAWVALGAVAWGAVATAGSVLATKR